MSYSSITLRLADSKAIFDENNQLFQGFIEKRRKRAVDFQVNGKLYTVNTHGVLCSRRIMDDGKTWYSFCCSNDELFQTLSEERRFAKIFQLDVTAKDLFFPESVIHN